MGTFTGTTHGRGGNRQCTSRPSNHVMAACSCGVITQNQSLVRGASHTGVGGGQKNLNYSEEHPDVYPPVFSTLCRSRAGPTPRDLRCDAPAASAGAIRKMGALADYSPRAASPTRDAPRGYRRDRIPFCVAVPFWPVCRSRIVCERSATALTRMACHYVTRCARHEIALRAYDTRRLNGCRKFAALKVAYFRARCVE